MGKRVKQKAHFKRGTLVQTPDGNGKIIGYEKRLNTNGGPGTNQCRIQLEDQRIRHYNPSKVHYMNCDKKYPCKCRIR